VLAAIPSSSRRSFARSSNTARCAANAVRTRRPPRSKRSPCPRPFRPSSPRASIASRSATRTCSRPRRGGTRRADGAAPCRGRSPRTRARRVARAASRRPSSSVPPELLGSVPSASPHARSGLPHTAAGSPRRTHAGVAQALLAIHGSAARRTPRSSPITSRRPASISRRALARARRPVRGARSDPADGVRHCRRVTKLLAALPESHETPDARAHFAHRAARDRPHRRHRRA